MTAPEPADQTRADVVPCSCCGKTPVLNARPGEDIVVCEPCMHLMWDADAAELRARAEAAEATVARVRAEVKHAEDHGAVDETDEPWVEVAVIRAALDGERP